MRKLPALPSLFLVSLALLLASCAPAAIKPVSLQMYLIGTEPEYHSEFNKKLNELLQRDFGASMRVSYIDFINWQSEYELVLSSGEQVDLVYTSYWSSHERYAHAGYFTPLNDFLAGPQANIRNLHDKAVWDLISVDAQVYAVPAAQKRYFAHGFLYRRDLDPRPGTNDIVDIDSLEDYLAAVRESSDIRPFNVSRSDAPTVLGMALRPFGFTYNPGFGDFLFNTPEGSAIPFISAAFAQGIEESLLRFRQWQLAGYFPPDFLERADGANFAFVKGESAVSGSISIADAYDDVRGIQAQHPDWEIGYWLQPSESETYQLLNPMQDAMAIGRRSVDPALAMQILEKIMTDREYYDLFFYGVEGIHYTRQPDRSLAEELVFSQSVERWNMSNWGFRNSAMMREQPLDWPEWERILETVSAGARLEDPETSLPDMQGSADIFARLNAIAGGAFPALVFGLGPDTLANLERLRAALREAGYNELLAAFSGDAGAGEDGEAKLGRSKEP